MSGDAEARSLPRWLPLALVLAVAAVFQVRARAELLWAGDTDAPKYLALAADLPGYTLYDDHPYLIHPPGYPIALRLTAACTPTDLPGAGPLLGAACVLGLVALVYLLGRRLLALSPAGACLAGLLLASSRAAEVLGQGTWREPFQTLAVYGLLAVTLLPAPTTRGGRRTQLVVSALGGALLGWTWDPFVFTLPLWLLGAWWLRRPPLLAAGLALALSWGGWASWRHTALTAGPSYPAGIDGLVEDTRDPPLKAWLNPNFLPRTGRHNAYFWPTEPTPLRPLRAAAPAWCGDPHYALTAPRPTPGLRLAATLLLVLGLTGLARAVRAPPTAWRAALLVGLVGGLLGGPGLIGRTARYGFALLPPLALLVALAIEPLWAARPRRGLVGVLGVGGALAVGWLATSHAWTWTRPVRFEARSAAAAIAALDTSGRAVAATINVTPDLAWGLRPRRVVTLPARPDWGLDALLADRDVGAIVVPHEVHPFERPGADPELVAEVHSLPTLRQLFGQAQGGALVHLGVALEAEAADAPRVRAFDVLWRGPAPPPAFGLWLEADSLPGLAAALEADAVSPETRRLLRAQRAAIERHLADPASLPAAERVLRDL